jgi:hypothetical protein
LARSRPFTGDEHARAASPVSPFPHAEGPSRRRSHDPPLADEPRHRHATCAVIAGAADFQQIALFATKRRDWLAQFLDLSKGLPSQDALRTRLRPDGRGGLPALLRPLDGRLAQATDGQAPGRREEVEKNQEPTNRSMAMKRFAAAPDADYHEEILTA